MKKLLALSLLLVSCSENQTSKSEDIAELQFVGQCTDLETPSKYKPIDTYEVEATLWVSKLSGDLEIAKYQTNGFVSVTVDELERRYEEQAANEFSGLADLDEWLAKTDVPTIDIADFPSTLLNQTEWKLSSIHNYTDDGSVYGERTGECSLSLKSKTGIIPEELFERKRLCFEISTCLIRGDTEDPLGIR